MEEKQCRDVKTPKVCEQGSEVNFGSYVNLPTLFTSFWGFDVPTSFSIFNENVFLLFLFSLFLLNGG